MSTSIPLGQRKWAVFCVIAIGAFMAMIDSSIVIITLPNIAHYFGVGLTGTVEWVVIAYLVVVAVMLPTIGRLADIIGYKLIWITGITIFTVGSMLCGVAPSLAGLVGFRALEGVGGALLIAIGPAMLTSTFPSSERGRALGLYNLVMFAGVIAGPALGGLLLQSFVWRVIFYVNVPLGLIGTFAAARILRRPAGRVQGRFDLAGAVCLAVGLASVTLGLSFGQAWSWGSTRTIALLIVAGGAFVAMVIIESHVPDPVLDLSLFRDKTFASSTVSLVLSFLALFSISFVLPFYLEELRGYSVIRSALLLMPFPLSVAVISPLSGSLADRIGTRWLQVIGLAVVSAGLVMVSDLRTATPLWQIVASLVITGLGRGLFLSPNSSALMGAAPTDSQGVASGVLATGETAGQCISVAVAGAIFVSAGAAVAGARLGQVGHGLSSAMADPAVVDLQRTFVHGYHLVFLCCAAIAAAGIVTSLVGDNKQRSAPVSAPQGEFSAEAREIPAAS